MRTRPVAALTCAFVAFGYFWCSSRWNAAMYCWVMETTLVRRVPSLKTIVDHPLHRGGRGLGVPARLAQLLPAVPAEGDGHVTAGPAYRGDPRGQCLVPERAGAVVGPGGRAAAVGDNKGQGEPADAGESHERDQVRLPTDVWHDVRRGGVGRRQPARDQAVHAVRR